MRRELKVRKKVEQQTTKDKHKITDLTKTNKELEAYNHKTDAMYKYVN